MCTKTTELEEEHRKREKKEGKIKYYFLWSTALNGRFFLFYWFDYQIDVRNKYLRFNVVQKRSRTPKWIDSVSDI